MLIRDINGGSFRDLNGGTYSPKVRREKRKHWDLCLSPLATFTADIIIFASMCQYRCVARATHFRIKYKVQSDTIDFLQSAWLVVDRRRRVLPDIDIDKHFSKGKASDSVVSRRDKLMFCFTFTACHIVRKLLHKKSRKFYSLMDPLPGPCNVYAFMCTVICSL